MTVDLDQLLERFANGSLADELLAAPRATPVVARVPLEESTSETVRRHASTFRRWRPVTGPPEPPPPHPAPEVYATRIEREDLELAARLLADPPSSLRTAVKNAETGRWTWAAHYGCGRKLGAPETVSESVVLRASHPGDFPWNVLRCVGVWRRTGGAGSWTFDLAARWRLESGRLAGELERLSAGELGWLLKTGGATTVNPRPPKKRESKAVAAARAAGELTDACLQ